MFWIGSLSSSWLSEFASISKSVQFEFKFTSIFNFPELYFRIYSDLFPRLVHFSGRLFDMHALFIYEFCEISEPCTRTNTQKKFKSFNWKTFPINIIRQRRILFASHKTFPTFCAATVIVQVANKGFSQKFYWKLNTKIKPYVTIPFRIKP